MSLFRSFVHFLIEHNCSVLAQLLNCKCSLYILDTISLSDILLQLSSPSERNPQGQFPGDGKEEKRMNEITKGHEETSGG